MGRSPVDSGRRWETDESPRGKRKSTSPDRSHEGRKKRRYEESGHGSAYNNKRRSRSPEKRGRSEYSRSLTRRQHRRDRSESMDSDRRRRRRSGSRSRKQSHRDTRPHRSRSRSPRRRDRRSTSPSEPPSRRSRKALPSQERSFRTGADGQSGELEPVKEKQKPNFKNTGLLAAESNKVMVGGGSGNKPKAIILKYNEPPEARKPPSSQPWMLYIFKGKGKDPIDTLPLYSRSCWLLGRETAVVDIPIENPSCSKQHAVFQFRYITKRDEFGDRKGKVGLYLIDLESENGTFLNGDKIEQARYVECLDKDVVKFGESEREYVLLLPSKE